MAKSEPSLKVRLKGEWFEVKTTDVIEAFTIASAFIEWRKAFRYLRIEDFEEIIEDMKEKERRAKAK